MITFPSLQQNYIIIEEAYHKNVYKDENLETPNWDSIHQ